MFSLSNIYIIFICYFLVCIQNIYCHDDNSHNTNININTKHIPIPIINLQNYYLQPTHMSQLNQKRIQYKSTSYYSSFINVTNALLTHDLIYNPNKMNNIVSNTINNNDYNDNTNSNTNNNNTNANTDMSTPIPTPIVPYKYIYNQFNATHLLSMLSNKVLTIIGDSTTLQMVEALEVELSEYLVKGRSSTSGSTSNNNNHADEIESDGIYIRSHYSIQYNFTLIFCLNRRFNHFHEDFEYKYTTDEHMNTTEYTNKLNLRIRCTEMGVNRADYIVVGVGAHYKPGYKAHGVVNNGLEKQVQHLNDTCK